MIIKWFQAVAVAVSVAIGAGYSYFWPGAKDDNPIEEAAEHVIKNQTGIDIDLTPRTPEQDAKENALDFVVIDTTK